MNDQAKLTKESKLLTFPLLRSQADDLCGGWKRGKITSNGLYILTPVDSSGNFAVIVEVVYTNLTESYDVLFINATNGDYVWQHNPMTAKYKVKEFPCDMHLWLWMDRLPECQWKWKQISNEFGM